MKIRLKNSFELIQIMAQAHKFHVNFSKFALIHKKHAADILTWKIEKIYCEALMPTFRNLPSFIC